MGAVVWWVLLAALSCHALQRHGADYEDSPRDASRAAGAAHRVAPGAAPRADQGPVPELPRNYGRFHANDSLIGRPVPCTRYEKLCFRYNLLYDATDKTCRYLEANVFGDRQEFLNGSGHLRVAANVVDECRSRGDKRAAFDGVCYKNMTCGCNSMLTTHILGGTECRCVPPKPLIVEQPPEDGRCIIPDLRFPESDDQFLKTPYDEIQGFRVTGSTRKSVSINPDLPLRCTAQHQRCIVQNQVWLNGDCFRLMERGPCPQDHVVALDAAAAFNGSVEATCAHVRGGCPTGHLRAAFDGSCHRTDDLKVLVRRNVFRNMFAAHIYLPLMLNPLIFRLRVEKKEENMSEGVCMIGAYYLRPAFTGGGVLVARPSCGSNDEKQCILYEVRAEPSQPEL